MCVLFFVLFQHCSYICFVGVCLFFKQKTAYEMRISDWSSDVCSSDLTPAEDRVIQALLERMFAALNAAWADVFDLQFSRISSESHPQFLSFLDPDDVVVVTRFLVTLPRGTSSPVDLVYPLQSLKPLLPLLRMRVITEQG